MCTSGPDVIAVCKPEPRGSGPAAGDVSAKSSCPADGGSTGSAPSVSSKPPCSTSIGCNASPFRRHRYRSITRMHGNHAPMRLSIAAPPLRMDQAPVQDLQQG